MAFGTTGQPVGFRGFGPSRGSIGLGADAPPPDVSYFHTTAAAPAPPVTGKAYVWPHPSGLFSVQIGPNGEIGGFTPPSAGLTDEQKAIRQIVEDTWVYPFIHGVYDSAHAVTGYERSDNDILAEMSHLFAFNKGMAFSSSAVTPDNPTGAVGTNTLQTQTIAHAAEIVAPVVQPTAPAMKPPASNMTTPAASTNRVPPTPGPSVSVSTPPAAASSMAMPSATVTTDGGQFTTAAASTETAAAAGVSGGIWALLALAGIGLAMASGKGRR